MRRFSLRLFDGGVLLCMALLSSMAVLPAVPAAGQGATTTVQVEAPDTVAPGSRFTARVNILNVTNLDAANYNVTFNMNVLRLESVQLGLIGTTPIPIDFPSGSSIGQGTVIVVQNVPGLQGVSGSGYLSVLNFFVIGSGGQSSSIGLAEPRALSSSLATPIQATWIGDNVTVVSDSTVPPPAVITTPTPSPSPTPSPAQPPPPPPTGSTPAPTLTLTPGKNTVSVSGSINRESLFTSDLTVVSEDKKASFSVVKDSMGMTRDKDPLAEISMSKVTALRAAPRGFNLIGGAYEFGPTGARFVPYATLTLRYTNGEVPADAIEQEVVMVFWDDEAKKYIPLEYSVADVANNAVSGRIDHFSQFALMAPTRLPPPAFSVRDLQISPSQVDPGENVTINARIYNTGGSEGKFDVALRINDTSENTSPAFLDIPAGENRRFSHTVTRKDGGKYSVNFNGLSGEFTVRGASPTPAVAKPAATPGGEPQAVVKTGIPASPPSTPRAGSRMLIVWIISGVLIIAVIAFVLISRFRR